MTFMSSLAANPSGGSGIYGQPDSNQDPLALVNNIKDREMRDYQNKANFMADLSLKQDRLRSLYNPEDPNNQLGSSATNKQSNQAGPQNVITGQDPNQINASQKAELGIRQQQANTESQRAGIESQRLAQTGKMGEERLGIQSAQEKLNQQKSDSIHEQKQNELTAKINESGLKLQQAQAALEAKTKAGQDVITEHENLAKAVEERHKLEMSLQQGKLDQKDREFEDLKKQHAEVMKQRGNKTTTTTVNPEGTQRTVNTRSGSAAQNVIKTLPNGDLHVSGGPKTGPGSNPSGEYDIPANQLDHWNSIYGQQTESQPDATP